MVNMDQTVKVCKWIWAVKFYKDWTVKVRGFDCENIWIGLLGLICEGL